jgi:hypothetical protein
MVLTISSRIIMKESFDTDFLKEKLKLLKETIATRKITMKTLRIAQKADKDLLRKIEDELVVRGEGISPLG